MGLFWPKGARGETMAGRIVVPELRSGQCIWMLGRVMDEERQPKYRGLSLPKPILGYERVRGRPRMFVTEGAFDYLTGVAWGLPMCALLGTQVRAERLSFLQRARRVLIVFDSDAPGREAAAGLAQSLGPRRESSHSREGVKDLSELATLPHGRATFFRSSGTPSARRTRVRRRPTPVLLEVIPSRWDDEPIVRARSSLSGLTSLGGSLSLEFAGTSDAVRFFVRASSRPLAERAQAQLGAAYPQAVIREVSIHNHPELDPMFTNPAEQVACAVLRLDRDASLPLRSDWRHERDPLAGALAASASLGPGERVVSQIILSSRTRRVGRPAADTAHGVRRPVDGGREKPAQCKRSCRSSRCSESGRLVCRHTTGTRRDRSPIWLAPARLPRWDCPSQLSLRVASCSTVRPMRA